MKGFSPAEIPTLGDTSLPWYDKDWPWNRVRKAFVDEIRDDSAENWCKACYVGRMFGWGATKPQGYRSKQLDLSQVTVVAAYAGRRDEQWWYSEPTQMLVQYANRWMVLIKGFDKLDATRHYGYIPKPDEEVRRAHSPMQSIVVGMIGDRRESFEFIWHGDGEYEKFGIRGDWIIFNSQKDVNEIRAEWNNEKLDREMQEHPNIGENRFSLDLSTMKAAMILVQWGFVQSPHWPTMLHRFPEFAETTEYLVFMGALWPDGTHPLHYDRAYSESKAESSGPMLSPVSLAAKQQDIDQVTRPKLSHREELIAEMADSWKFAILANDYAESKAGKKLTAKASYHWLKENGFEGYKLPPPRTFADYLTKARSILGEQRKTPKGARRGRSIVSLRDLDGKSASD